MKWLPLGVGLGLVLWQLTPMHGHMGHDFYHYFARIHLGMLHFWQNGFAVFHYTPSLCGGLPVFADPQSMFYSVPQFLSFAIDPLMAVLLTHGIFHLVGYIGFHRLLGYLGMGSWISHFGALLFLLNGFSFAHLLVGHMTHHSYPLFPWILLFVLRGNFPRDMALLCLALIYTFYSGGTHMIVVFAAGGLLLAPWLLARKIREGNVESTVSFLVLSAVLVLLACSPKLAASARLAESFLDRPIDASRLSLPTLVKQYFWFNPETTPHTIPFGKWHFGPWEFVGFVSVLLIPVVPGLLARTLWRPRTKTLGLALAYFGVVYLLLWVGAARHSEMGIPILKGYHNPIKIYGAFIPFLILGMAVLLRDLGRVPKLVPKTPWVRAALFGIASLTVILEFRVNSQFFVSNRLVYGYEYRPERYVDLKGRGGLPPVTRVTETYGTDVKGIQEGFTSNKCFEPMFGYRREVMKATVVPGPTDLVRDGAYNLTHPGCLIYPRHFRCERWARIPASQTENFSKFVRGEIPDWGVPPWQQALLVVGLLTVVALLATALSGVFRLKLPRLRLRRPVEVTA